MRFVALVSSWKHRIILAFLDILMIYLTMKFTLNGVICMVVICDFFLLNINQFAKEIVGVVHKSKLTIILYQIYLLRSENYQLENVKRKD